MDVKHPEIEVELVGSDGNAYAVLGKVSRALRRGGVPKDERDVFMAEATSGDTKHELALAGACYAAPDRIYMGTVTNRAVKIEDAWPWLREEWKGDPDVRCWYPSPLADRLLVDNTGR